MKNRQKYVVRCVKPTNAYGFGHRYRTGQFVTYSGKPTDDLQRAWVYINGDPELSCGVNDLEGWEEFFEFLPVKIELKSS